MLLTICKRTKFIIVRLKHNEPRIDSGLFCVILRSFFVTLPEPATLLSQDIGARGGKKKMYGTPPFTYCNDIIIRQIDYDKRLRDSDHYRRRITNCHLPVTRKPKQP